MSLAGVGPGMTRRARFTHRFSTSALVVALSATIASCGAADAPADSTPHVALSPSPTDVVTPPPPSTAPSPAPPSDVEPLAEGATPELGRRYAVPLYIHCGMDWLYVAGAPWQRTDGGRDVETGAGDPIPDGWPVKQQSILGFVTLTEEDHIEYSLEDGEVIATYAPATDQPPGCA